MKKIHSLSMIHKAFYAGFPLTKLSQQLVGVTALGLALSIVSPVRADTFTVTTTSPSGPGSLAEVVSLANARPDIDTINFSSVSGEISLAESLILNGPVDINGPGREQLMITLADTVSGQAGSLIFNSLGGRSSLSDLTVSGDIKSKGYTVYNPPYHDIVFSRLNLNNVSLSGRVDAEYAGVNIDNSSVGGLNSVASSSIAANRVVVDGGEIVTGGPGYGPRSRISCTDCTISGSSIYVHEGSDLSFVNSSISNTSAFEISGGGNLSIHRSVLSGSRSRVKLMTIKNNRYEKSVVISESLIRDAEGDAIVSEGREINILNSTISNGTGFAVVGLKHHDSDPNDSREAIITLTNSTITGNAGGISVDSHAQVQIRNSIVAGNSSSGQADTVGAGQVNVFNSLVGKLRTSYAHNAGSDFLFGRDPRLGALADNGGPTPTHALLADSPAIDAGDDAICPAADQRAFARPQGASCDIGAYEADVPLAINVQVNGLDTKIPGPTLSVGSNLAWTYTANNAGNDALHDVTVRVRQKSPVFGQWQTVCALGTLSVGDSASCDVQDLAIDDRYIALVAISGMTSAGKTVEATFKVFYRGEITVTDPGLITKRSIALDVLAAKGFDQITHDAFLAEINAATSVSELHAIIVQMRESTDSSGTDPRLDAKRVIALNLLDVKGFDQVTHDALLAEINAASSVSELHAMIVQMREATDSAGTDLRLDAKRTIALNLLEAKSFDPVMFDALLAEITAATRVSELHEIILRMRQG